LVSAANVDFSATDRMFVCAGVTKKAEVPANIVELSSSLGTNTFSMNGAASATQEFGYVSRGSTSAANGAALLDDNALIAPVTVVSSGLSIISGDAASLRINGVLRATATGDQGTGNYRSDLVYLLARGGASVFNNSSIYQLIAVGKTPTTSELNQTETFVAAKTKGSLA